MCIAMFFKGPNFEETQSTDSNGLAVGYVKREMTLFFDDDNSLLWVIAPPCTERNDMKTQYFKPTWGVCNHETEKKVTTAGRRHYSHRRDADGPPHANGGTPMAPPTPTAGRRPHTNCHHAAYSGAYDS